MEVKEQKVDLSIMQNNLTEKEKVEQRKNTSTDVPVGSVARPQMLFPPPGIRWAPQTGPCKPRYRTSGKENDEPGKIKGSFCHEYYHTMRGHCFMCQGD